MGQESISPLGLYCKETEKGGKEKCRKNPKTPFSHSHRVSSSLRIFWKNLCGEIVARAVVVVVMSSSSERPVPRRESPWGRPDGDTRQPKAHRCNDRVEDVVQACFEGNPFKTVPGPFKLLWRCMRSKPGEEPTEPFTYLELDPPKREEIKLE